MRNVLRSSFLWEFLGGFAVATLVLTALHPSAAVPAPAPMHAAVR